MFADQLDVGFLDDTSSLRHAIGVPKSNIKSADFDFLENDIFGSNAELEDACGVLSETEDYSRMLYEWQQHIGLISSDLLDFDDPLSGSCFRDGQFVPPFSENAATKNSKGVAALEADDLDSLLAQFEASQGGDWLLGDCISPVEPLLNKSTDSFKFSVVDECVENNVVEEIIVDADDEAEYIDVESLGEEEMECRTNSDNALGDQRLVDLDHDYCQIYTSNDSEVDIEEDCSDDGLYNKIPSYYHETALLRGNICSSPIPEDVTEEIVIDDSPDSPLETEASADSGLYCRLPPYIAEGLPCTVNSDCSEVTESVFKPIFTSHLEAQPELNPSVDTLVLNADDDDVASCIEGDQMNDCVSVVSSVPFDNGETATRANSPQGYSNDDEYCRYYERKSRQRHRRYREARSRYNRYSSSRSPTRSRSSRSRSSSSSSTKSRSHSRSWSRSRSRSRSPSNRRSYSSRSSRWENREERLKEWRRNKMRPIEERRIIYVGNISSGTTRNDLRRRFSVFGPIEEVTVHYRDHGDDYGFVTFLYKVDAFEALAHGNDDRSQPQYDLCFGGRRHFCQSRYADLDGLNAIEQVAFSSPEPQAPKKPVESDFDAMLRAAQASRKSKLQKGNS